LKRKTLAVVGSGPNGLSCALVLAREGHDVTVFEGQPTIGGGARTHELTLPGFRHDVCSAIHPMALASPFFRSLQLQKYGVEFLHSAAAIAHPLRTGEVVLLKRSVEETADQLDEDAGAYQQLMKPLVQEVEGVLDLLLNPVAHVPKAPLVAAKFGLLALRSAESFLRDRFTNPKTQALLAGCAAHSFSRLDAPLTNAVGLSLAMLGHAFGWPVIKGGTQSLSNALVRMLEEAGGSVQTSYRISDFEQVKKFDGVFFDTHAHVMARVCQQVFPAWYRAELQRFRLGPGTFKLDYALSAPMPWLNEACLEAATVHLGGTLDEIARSELELSLGGVPKNPYVLVAQQSLIDNTRAPLGQHTLWAYCHVPNGNTHDATSNIEGQLQRFAPGFSKFVLARHATSTQASELHNESYVGGDISHGAVDGFQALLRPTLGRPYVTPLKNVFLCGSSSPPGPAVHGMAGFHAANVALSQWR
jgi:phytoene dehydrogenase-like protein